MFKKSVAWLVIVLVLAVGEARAEFPFSRPYPAVEFKQEKRSDPPQRIYVAKIDMSNPLVQVRVSRGGPDPDGDGEWTTTLMRPTKIAEREGFDVVVNGDFFSVSRGKDAEGEAAIKEFKNTLWATVSGPAETDDAVWAKAAKPRAAFMIDDQKRMRIDRVSEPPKDVVQAIAGSGVIVKDGKNVAPPADKPGFSRGPHPRTALGIADGGKTLLLVVVDGRQKGVAVGMSLPELAEVMIKHGAQHALNLDGGGSSMMGIRNPKTRKIEIVNVPSDGAAKGLIHERAVANVLGVTVTKRPPATKPSE
jgi:exopolysaccharide biosynthesis protein